MSTTPVKAKDFYVSVATTDISAYSDKAELKRSGDKVSKDGFGTDSHSYEGTLKGGTFTVSGWYDKTAVTGTRAVLYGQEGNSLAIVYRIEGTGSSLPEDQFSAILDDYTETSAVADIVRWSASFTVNGDITTTTQGA